MSRSIHPSITIPLSSLPCTQHRCHSHSRTTCRSSTRRQSSGRRTCPQNQPVGFDYVSQNTKFFSSSLIPFPPFFTVNVCQECGKSFSSKTRYRAHLRRHNSKTSGRYQCKQCDKNFVQRSSLTTHTRIHTGERPFKCNDCSDCFGDYSTFTKHQRTHTGRKALRMSRL